MNDYQRCPICKQWGWMSRHTCPLAYGVRLEDWNPDEEVVVYASDPEQAATRFLAERFSDLDYPHSATVIVNEWRATRWSGHLYKYEITVETVPSFTAKLIEDHVVKPKNEDGDK